jgi:peptidoglycan/LPS O-acetylase OafA/YrhL
MENVSVVYPSIPTPPPASPVSQAKVYFKNLDGIRCLAAVMVLMQHVSDYKKDLGTDVANAERPFVSSLGMFGVTLFFVLSGFLIFYLLFTEKKLTGTVRVKDFYIRRMLRIWPLYFGFGILSILGIDLVLKYMGAPVHTPVAENFFYLFTFSINLQMVFTTMNRGIIELYWSVCIEEQFYLFAPWLVKKGKAMLSIILGLIATGIFTRFLMAWLHSSHTVSFDEALNPLGFFTTCWFDAFGYGIFAAWLHFNRDIYQRIRPVVENRWIQGAVLLFTLLYITNIIPRPELIEEYFFSTIPAILFAFIILAASTGNFIFNLEYPLLKRIGRYSYGIYVFHASIAQICLFVFLKLFSRSNVFVFEFLYPLTCLAGVILVSGLSYELYEKRFLRIKKKFTLVQNQKYN